MNRGDVVEVFWYYTDMSGGKQRPEVALDHDFLNGLVDDTILVQITSTRHAIPGTEVELDPSIELGSGLSRVCVASCMNVVTVEQARILQVIGFLSDAAMQQIEACLKTVLDIR
jgi:mRNA-degrading endonuclease toxin of MazEF toxin-antitoxin module